MSRVFLAEETRLGRQVVVKLLPPDMGAAVNTERFEREIQLAARLQHPHIVPLLTAASSGDLLYYVMPYIAGESLRARLGRDGALPVNESVKILREVVDALAYAHENGVVHRDIKPDNVLLSTGHAVVTDFGVAKAVSVSSGGKSSLTSLGVALGTPAYMAPEQAAADPHVDHRADIYAVGALAYEMLTGRTPFVVPTPQAMLAAHITQTPDPVSKHRPAVPPALNALLMRCLEKHPADRWQTASELLAQLEVVLTPSGGLTPSAAMPAVSSGTEEALKRSQPVRVALIFVAVAVAVLGLVYGIVRFFGLPDWVFFGAIGLMAVGLPIILLTGYFERRRAVARATGRIVPPDVSGVHRLFTWRKSIRGGLLAFGALGIAAVIYTAMRLLGIGPVGTLVASGRLSAKDHLVVADFENHTTDPNIAASITEAFRIDLGQSAVVRILTTSQISDGLTRMQRDPNAPLTAAIARELATRAGAKAVVAGEISALGKGYVLSARIVSAADGSELVALRETAEDDGGIVAALDKLSGRVRERIGESLKTIRGGQPLEQVTTSSLEALRLYSEGARLSDLGEGPKAVPLLRQAIALDSGFAMAWRKLAVVLANTLASEEEIVAAASRAYEHRDRLPDRERQLAIAYYHSAVDYDPEKQEAAYRRVLDTNPEDHVASNNLSVLLTRQERPAEAEAIIAPEVARTPGFANAYLQLVAAQVGEGHFPEAHKTLDLMAKLAPEAPLRIWASAFALTAMGDLDGGARAYLDLGLKSREPADQEISRSGLARIEQTQGRLAESERQTRLAMQASEQRGLNGNALGGSANLALQYVLFRGDTAGALRLLDEALRRHPLDSITPLDRPTANIVMVYAAAGQVARARELLAAYESSVPEGVRRGHFDWHAARGGVALAEGKGAEAAKEFIRGRRSDDCVDCGAWEEGLAFERANQPDSAIAAYERAAHPGSTWKPLGDAWGLGPSLKRLGELYEERGDKTKALENYGRFVELWKDADPVLQPVVRAVKTRMAKLAGE